MGEMILTEKLYKNGVSCGWNVRLDMIEGSEVAPVQPEGKQHGSSHRKEGA